MLLSKQGTHYMLKLNRDLYNLNHVIAVLSKHNVKHQLIFELTSLKDNPYYKIKLLTKPKSQIINELLE